MYKVTSLHDSADVYVEGPDGQIFANAGIVRLYPTSEEAEAATKANVENARRIAACLNACAGLDTKIVQTIAAFGGMCQDNAVKAITAERDQLVDALREIADWPRDYEVCEIAHKALTEHNK